MTGMADARITQLRLDSEKVLRVLEQCEVVDKQLQVPSEEFARRKTVVWQARSELCSCREYAGEVWDAGGEL